MHSLDLGMIGNCAFSALIDNQARVVWSCLPRFDSPPVFSALIDGDGDGDGDKDQNGIYEIEMQNFDHSKQYYRGNSAILVTELYDTSGAAMRVTDFAPRYVHHERSYRPLLFVRHIEPMQGAPRIRIKLRPSYGSESGRSQRTRGSNHIRYVLSHMTLRLTTNMPVAYIIDEAVFTLDRKLTMMLGDDESLTRSIDDVTQQFYRRTLSYWTDWSRSLSIPFEWQEEIIRAAITLKLCSFEETGAIIAAATTSIPEAPLTERNWDYRYCWLRDSYFVVNALNSLGVTRTMENYLRYLNNIVSSAEDGYLQPVFGITQEKTLTETTVESLAGYRGMGPVRFGNGAYKQIQNDGYGAVILASAQSFYDQRLTRMSGEPEWTQLERVGQKAIELWNTPDAGLWEYRTREAVHTFSAVMCWAACDRLARIGSHLGKIGRAEFWQQNAKQIRGETMKRGWNAELGSFVDSFDGDRIDASLLLFQPLGFIAADDPRFLGTLAMVERHLKHGKFIFRYITEDDFGAPETAFNICTFWYINALAAVGRKEEARELFENMLASRNSLGMLSEDIDPNTGALWGNFPQTYSMVGLINSAMLLSEPWESAI